MSIRPTSSFDPDRYPALSQFAAGYLHEDFVVEHGTVKGAREAFLRDASARERAAFGREGQRFVEETAGLSWADARGAFAALGGAWRPASRAALTALFEAPATPATATRRGRP
jgi:hypothetical protein